VFGIMADAMRREVSCNMNSAVRINLTTNNSGKFNRLEVRVADSFCDTHATDVSYNFGVFRRGNCPMPGIVVAELPNAPAALGQRLLDRSRREGKEMRFLLTEDDRVVRFCGFVALMAWSGGPCHIRMTQLERIKWKMS